MMITEKRCVDRNTIIICLSSSPAGTVQMNLLLSCFMIPLNSLGIILWNASTVSVHLGKSCSARPHYPVQRPCDTTSPPQPHSCPHLRRNRSINPTCTVRLHLPAQPPYEYPTKMMYFFSYEYSLINFFIQIFSQKLTLIAVSYVSQNYIVDLRFLR